MFGRDIFILNQFSSRMSGFGAALLMGGVLTACAPPPSPNAIRPVDIATATIFGEEAEPAVEAHGATNAAAKATPALNDDRTLERDCAAGEDALGVSRTVVLDPTEGRHYGRGREGYEPTAEFLQPKEVVLTFDDGPHPRSTRKVLQILREYCVKATFFVVGRAAKAHPDILAEIAADGHTIAGHTRSHPMPFARRSRAAAAREIELGYDDVEEALGAPAAPLFRFPGLSDSAWLLEYLREKERISLSIDVDSGDTHKGATTAKVIRKTIRDLDRRGRGVVLFHDPLKRTARALPSILKALKRKGYRIVHVTTAPAERPAVAASPFPVDIAAARR